MLSKYSLSIELKFEKDKEIKEVIFDRSCNYKKSYKHKDTVVGGTSTISLKQLSFLLSVGVPPTEGWFFIL